MSRAPTSCPWRCGGWDGCIRSTDWRPRPALGGGRSRPPEACAGGASLTRALPCRLVGHYGVQEDRMDLHTVQVESHVMDPDLEVSMMPPLEEQGLMTIPMDPMAPNMTVEEQPPLTPPT